MISEKDWRRKKSHREKELEQGLKYLASLNINRPFDKELDAAYLKNAPRSHLRDARRSVMRSIQGEIIRLQNQRDFAVISRERQTRQRKVKKK